MENGTTLTELSDLAFETFKKVQAGEPYTYTTENRTWTLKKATGGYYHLTHDKSDQKKKLPARAALRILTHIFNKPTSTNETIFKKGV